MTNNLIKILSTRPLAETVMENARAKDFEIDIASFIETNNTIDQITGRKISQYASKEIAVVFTSMNAAEAVIDCLNALGAEPEWTIYTLGGVTQKILEDALTGSEIFGDAINAAQIAKTIIENEEEEVVFFCGNQRRDELPSLLKREEIKVDEVVVYETIETPVKIKKEYSGILFFSPSAVKSFFKANTVDSNTVLFAIGTTTADELKKHSNNKVLIGSQPNKEFLAEQAMQYLLKANQAD
ncbi:MAG: Uroporphyrinogen synthase [Segetibacter sp.]|nr:Uroporphyrinogen synthase [Segetibacter sp.]